MKKRNILTLVLAFLAAVIAAVVQPFKAATSDRRLWAPGMPVDGPGCAVLAYDPIDAEITVTQSASGTFSCAIQLKGGTGEDLQQERAVQFYLSKNSDGSTICADGTDTSEIAIGTDGLLVEEATDVSGMLVSEADGDIDLTVTVEASKVAYLVIVLPNGRLVISDAMTYGM